MQCEHYLRLLCCIHNCMVRDRARKLVQYSNLSRQASKTTLNIADVLDMNGADHEEVLAMIRQARNLAQTSGNFKMEARALSEAIRVMKKTNLICDASKCSKSFS